MYNLSLTSIARVLLHSLEASRNCFSVASSLVLGREVYREPWSLYSNGRIRLTQCHSF